MVALSHAAPARWADRADEHAQHFDPFRVLSPAERERQLGAYLRILERRDGEIDFQRRTLSAKEAYFEGLARDTVSWEGRIDREAFEACLDGRGKAALDERTRWLAALAKSNEGECYGVEGEIRKYFERGIEGIDPRELYVLLEEQYHTRILMEACRTCGLELALKRPPRIMRLLIAGMHYLPASVRYIPILCGEMMGVVVFARLRELSRLFADAPEVETRLRSLLDEIWVDELFHVAYCRLRLGPAAMRVARLVAPLVAHAMIWAVPHVKELGYGRRELVRRFLSGVEIPPNLEWLGTEPAPPRRVRRSRATPRSDRLTPA